MFEFFYIFVRYIITVIILRLVIGSSAGDVTDSIMKLVSGGK